MSKSDRFRLPTPCKGDLPRLFHTGLPTPPPSSQLFSQDEALFSDLSDIEVISSPPQIKSFEQSEEPSRKRKHWQIEEDATIVKMVLLRKLFPHREDINWYSICTELKTKSGHCDAYKPGSVRSRFFSTMHGVARSHGISHKDLCWRLAMPFESKISGSTSTQLPAEIMSDPLPVPHERNAALRKLNDLAFNAKLRQARQALDAHRPDIVAQRKASEGLRRIRCSQIPSSPPTRSAATTPGFNERMAAIPILSDLFPEPPKSTFDSTHSQLPPPAQRPLSRQSQANTQTITTQSSTQLSEAAAQLQTDLTTYIQPGQRQQWQWDEKTRGYIPKVMPTLEQNMWRNPTEIYNSAIAYNVKVQKGKKKEKLFVYENPLMNEQVNKKRSSNSAKAQRRARRREGRGFEGTGRKKERKVSKKGKKRPSHRQESTAEKEQANPETDRRMKELQARLAAKILGSK